MASIIDYKNRAVQIANGISDDGQTNAAIFYDRFDKVTYIVELDGDLVKMDGTAYVPTPIPNGQTMQMVLIWNPGTSAVDTARLIFNSPVPVADLVAENFTFSGGEILSVTIANSDENWNVQHPDNTMLDITFTGVALEESYSATGIIGNGTGEVYNVSATDATLLTVVDTGLGTFYDSSNSTTYLEPCSTLGSGFADINPRVEA